eukprot:m.29001 g.29001  ORF g.29001 m.29001 type:complete len:303 (+) comp11911_c0_seq1:399-1307(+)
MTFYPALLLALMASVSSMPVFKAVPKIAAPLYRTDRDSSFDFDLAALSVELSAAAYCTDGPISNWTCKPCIESKINLEIKAILYCKTTDTHGYVGIHNDSKTVVVSFQGTHSVRQWVDDLTFSKVPLNYTGASSDVLVHKGFLHAYSEVENITNRIVNEAVKEYPGYTVHVTGHSLGAAIATLCSLDLAINNPTMRITQYTFGQPRVGNEAFAQFHKQSSVLALYRTVHHKDIVPHLPPLSFGFDHVATEVYYQEEFKGPSSLRVCDGSGEDYSCSNQFLAPTSVSDHLNYLGKPLSSDACY